MIPISSIVNDKYTQNIDIPDKDQDGDSSEKTLKSDLLGRSDVYLEGYQ